MPEQELRSRRHRYPLSEAHECGQIIRVRCTWCSITRNYLPADLMKLFGDVSWWEIGRHMRCAECSKKEYLDVNIMLPTAREWLTLKLRRLQEIKFVRRPIWRDD